jgi:hypothetical protein
MRRFAMWALLAAASAAVIGCDPMADRMVDRHETQLAADLRVRGQLARAAIETQFETFRAAKHGEISAARAEALAALDGLQKLDARSAAKAADTFANLHHVLDVRVDAAKAIAIKQTEWFDTAAETVLAAMEYRQTRDAAAIEGFKAGLEAFGTTYAATKREPADESEAKAQGLIEQIETQLRGMLQGYVGVIPVSTK